MAIYCLCVSYIHIFHRVTRVTLTYSSRVAIGVGFPEVASITGADENGK